MLKPLVCGSGSFPKSTEGMELCEGNKTQKPCKCRTKLCNKGVMKSKNPYATRGLDKFSSLVAVLKEKRQRIYEQTKDSSDDIYVWFNFSGSDECKPVILKLKNKHDKNEKKTSNKSQETAMPCSLAQAVVQEMKKSQVTEAMGKSAKPCACAAAKVHKTEMTKSKSFFDSKYFHDPKLRLLGAVIVILILLTMFGRSGAVILITVGWYMLPASTTDSRCRTKLGLNNKKTKDAPAKIHEIADQRGRRRSG